MIQKCTQRSGRLLTTLIGLLVVEATAQADAPACAQVDDTLSFVLTCAHGDITTESTADARGEEWLTTTTFTTDDGFFSNTLTIEGTARHVMPPPLPPHGEGINPNQYMHSFTALVDGRDAGVYTHNDFEVIVVVGPPLMHGGHFNHFHRSVTLRVGTSDDILNYTYSLVGRHSEYSRVDVYTGRLLSSISPVGPTFGSATLLVDPERRFTLGSVVSGAVPGDVVASHIHSALDGQVLFDMGDGSQWTNLDGMAASRAIGDDQLSPLALQLIASGNALFDVHLRSGEIVQGRLQLVPEPAAVILVASIALGWMAMGAFTVRRLEFRALREAAPAQPGDLRGVMS